MKFILLLCLTLVTSISLMAQTSTPAQPKKTTAKTGTKTGKSTKSSKAKKKKTTGQSEYEEVICYEDGPCTFSLLSRDTLVYEVNSAGKQYNLIVIPNKFNSATLADFNWKSSAPENKSGHVVISAAALNTGKRYMLDLPSGELKLSDASTFWLSTLNFKEITKGETSLSLDNGQAETFKSPESDAVVASVTYKGKALDLEGFSLQTKPEGEAGRKEIWVMNISNNLLMIKIDNGNWSMQLKEVRARKK